MADIVVREVKTAREKKEFLNYPLRLYRGNACFVPPLYADEKKIFRPDYVYYDTCEAVYFNAYRNGVMVGRISGILQKAANEKNGERRVRFTRFDAIDDVDVAHALFGAVEDWAATLGMDTVCGPLGFSDLEREGLLVEGFDELSTFEEQYNAPYYGKLIEACGYAKEVDWLESQLRSPADTSDLERMQKMSDFVMKRYNLHFHTAKTTKEFLDKYADGIFELLDSSYVQLYGTVPFTPGMRKLMLDNFKLIINLNFVSAILDENEKVVCFGVCFPSLAKAMQTRGGHLTPLTLLRTLRALKHPQVIDLGLIGVDEKYANRGVSTAILVGLFQDLNKPGVQYAETNLNLENNFDIQNMWKHFDARQHKRRRSYVKVLSASTTNEEGN